MRFAWTDDQLAFRDAVRELLAKECPPSVVRAAWDAPAGDLDLSVWESLDGMGVLSVLVPEDDGGLGLDECFLVPILEEAGRVALPHPIVDTAMVAAPLGLLGVVATDLGGAIVPCALDADVLLLRIAGALRSFEPDEVELTPVATVDRGRRAGRVRPQGDGNLVTDDPAEVALAHDRGVLGAAAQLVGLSRAMLDLTVAYVVERQQFGVPIGSFQAVKHHLTDALLQIEFAAPAVARAAASLAEGSPTVGRDVSMAKAMATDAVETAGRGALQCHGAIGYTVEHDLHLFLKRAWALSRTWGDRGFHADRVATVIGRGG